MDMIYLFFLTLVVGGLRGHTAYCPSSPRRCDNYRPMSGQRPRQFEYMPLRQPSQGQMILIQSAPPPPQSQIPAQPQIAPQPPIMATGPTAQSQPGPSYYPQRFYAIYA